jgi:hypothetical protein
MLKKGEFKKENKKWDDLSGLREAVITIWIINLVMEIWGVSTIPFIKRMVSYIFYIEAPTCGSSFQRVRTTGVGVLF